jgi:hypothetical protein
MLDYLIKNNEIAGTYVMVASTTSDTRKNGMMYLNMLCMLIFATAAPTNKLHP